MTARKSVKNSFKLPQVRLRLITWIFLFIAVVAIPTIIKKTLFPTEIEAGWWNEGWIYRQRVDVTNNESSDLTDFQIQITLDTAALITAGKMQSDCDDIRITDHKGQLIPFWVEDGTADCNISTTKIWTKIPNLPADNGTIYLYYGNSSAINKESPSAVFDYFQNFENYSSTADITSAGWVDLSINGASMSYNSNNGSNSSKAMLLDPAGGSGWKRASVYDSNQSFSSGSVLEYFYKATNDNYYDGPSGFSDRTTAVVGSSGGADGTNMVVFDGNRNTSGDTFKTEASDTQTSNAADVTRTGSHKVTIHWGATSKFIFDDSLIASSTTNIPSGSLNIFLSQFPAGADAGVGYFDDIRVRQYTANEPTTAQASEETTPGPVAYWKFDEGVDNTCSGGTNDTCDSTSQGNDLAKTNATWQNEDMCVSGKCLNFDGSGDYLTIADNTNLQLTSTGTVEAWIKPHSYAPTSGWKGILNKGNWGGGRNYYSIYYQDSNSSIRFDIGGPSANNSISTISNTETPLNEWSHVALVWDGSNVKAYINGVEKGSISQTVTPDTSTYDFYLGDISAGGYSFDGDIDQAKIYPYARSADQVKQDYNALGGPAAGAVLGAQEQVFMSEGLVGYWKMDEASATTTVTDHSGNGNTGTISLWGGGNTATASARVAGKYGGGIDFDGGDDYINIPNYALGADGDYDSFTLTSWINSNGGTSQVIFGTQQNDCDGLEIYSGDIRLGTAGNCVTWTSAEPSTGSWHHIAVTINNSKSAELFIDGISQGTKDISGFDQYWGTGNEVISYLGKDYCGDNTCFFDGIIDEARIYSRALSSGEVSALYNWAPGPVGYWPMDENTGTSTTSDRSGNGNNGTMTGSMTEDDWVTGKIGSALEFDGSNDYVSVTGANLNDSGALTMMAWINTSSLASTQSPFGYGAVNDWVNININTNGTYLIWDDLDNEDSSINGTTTLQVNTWYHVTVIIQADNTKKLYLNGIQEASDNTNATNATNISNDTINFGRRNYGPTSYQFSGKIDDFKVYNYARTPAQIQQDMGGVGGSILGSSTLPNPIAHWKFDERQGQTTNDSISSYNGTRGADSGSSTDDPTWKNQTNCKVNGCLDFDGGDYVSNTNSDLLNALEGSSNWSISFWAASNSYGTNPAALSINNSSNTSQLFLIYPYDTNGGNGTRIFFNGTSTININNANIADGNFHHFAYVSESATSHKLYIDGSLAGSSTTSKTLYTTIAGVNIGNWYTTNQHYTGQIDEVKIYNTALTADQIKKDMNAGSVLSFSTGVNEAADIIDGAGNNPIAEWSFDENTGDYSYDTSGSGYDAHFGDGTASEKPSWKKGKIGKSLYFDGTDDWVLGDNTINGALAQDTQTIEVWVKPDFVDATKYIMGSIQGPNTGSCCYRWYIRSNASEQFEFTIYDGANQTITSDTTFSRDSWYHIAISYSDGGTIRMYIDGKAEGTPINLGGITQFGELLIGTQWNPSPPSNTWKGNIDQIKIYDYIRTPAQIAYDYNRGKPIAHWKFDECQGATINDNSGNGNSGTLTVGGSGTQTAIGTCNTASTAWGNGTSGKFSSSLNFDGTDDYINLSLSGATSFTTPSIAAWIKIDSSTGTWQVPLALGTNPTLNIACESSDNQSCGCDLYNGATNPVDIGYDTWTHITCTLDGTNMTQYINGVQTSTEATSITPDNLINIGRGRSSQYYTKGQIDDVRIYNYALSLKQIGIIMNEGATVRYGD